MASSAKEVILETPRQKVQRIRDAAGAGTIVKTGFKDIDSLIRGFEEGRLYVIGARPKVGNRCSRLTLFLTLWNRGPGFSSSLWR